MNKISFEAAVGSAIGVIGAIFGSADQALLCLFIFMIMDVVLGLVDVIVFGKSKYGKNMSSSGLFKGAVRKGVELCLIIVAVQLDKVLGVEYLRTGVIFYLIATEGVSIIENLGRAGVPIPSFLSKILDVMQDTYDKGGPDNDA